MPDVSKQRRQQIVLILLTLMVSWLGMQLVHECGHVLAGIATGASVDRIILHPLTISRTDFSENPRPLIVVWGGPIFGVMVPVVSWRVVCSRAATWAFLVRFFAGFCCVANGAYLFFGSFDGVGDCGDLLRHGATLWQLRVFGVVAMSCGFWLWHGLGPHFGFGATPHCLHVRHCVVLATIAGLMLLIGLTVAR